MSRNSERHFAMNPSLDIGRSKFDRSSSVKFTFNVGQVVPFYVDEVLPGDTFNIKTSKVVRMQPMVTPIMDNIFLDTYYFFVPNRLVWSHWKQFCGENTDSAWIPSVDYSVPQVTAPTNGWKSNTIADYMGVPVRVPGISVNALPFRAYALICNDWFRSESLQDPLVVPVTDATVTGTNGECNPSSNYHPDACAGGGGCFYAGKFHDYFTSCLPAPQKGPDVLIPGSTRETPVYTMPYDHWSSPVGYGDDHYGIKIDRGDIEPRYIDNDNNSLVISRTPSTWSPLNLWAVPSTGVNDATINALRTAFQIQKFFEADARGGTRYIELIKSHFGVTSPDARMQRPEYLGGNRIPISVKQIIQQSATVEGSTPQGTPTGLSFTSDSHGDFSKSFTEHGFVIGVCVARYHHTYQQGLERFWSRRTKFDYYWPEFSSIGEMSVKNKEVYAQGTPEDDEVFGYAEAWADYRFKPSRVAGEMRSSTSEESLDVWHLGDYYTSLPHLSPAWIHEDYQNVNRVLAVQAELGISQQMFADFYIENRCVRPMPVYSIPGLADHH